MTSVFDPKGRRVSVTKIQAGPNVILGSTQSKVKLGFGKKKKVKKTENAFVKVAGYAPRFVREFKTESKSADGAKQFLEGEIVDVSIFKRADEVKVTGVTKGKGFAGVVKRWNFAGGPKTHGQSDRHRAPGSIGAGTTPGRVLKGKRMAGHMGVSNLTITGLEVVDVDSANNVLVVKGSVPGPRRGLLIIQKTGEVKGSAFGEMPANAEDTDEVATTENAEGKTAITEDTEKIAGYVESESDGDKSDQTMVVKDKSGESEQENPEKKSDREMNGKGE